MATETRDSPLPHKQTPKFINERGKRVRPDATDLTYDEFLVYSLKTSVRLAQTVWGLCQGALLKYLQYLEFLCMRRRNYDSDVVLNFDDDFRTVAKFDKLKLSETQERAIICDHYFHARTRKLTYVGRKKQKNTPLFRAANQRRQPRKYRFACCFHCQDGKCTAAPGECYFPHVRGHCGGEHGALFCKNGATQRGKNVACH